LSESPALDIAIALIDTRALADQAETQPLHRTETELAPSVREAVPLVLQVVQVLGFDVEVGNAVCQARLEPRGDALRGTEHRAQ
jgi:hypothetical protein